MRPAQKSTQKSATITKKSKGFTDEERAAIRDRVEDLKADEKDGENLVLAKIAEMREPDRTMSKRIHAIIKESVPTLTPRLWYGMPAYAKDDKVVCFFEPGQKCKTRYATCDLSDKAHLDAGRMWPDALPLRKLTAVVEARI